jgi:perosamine synthetase
MYVVLASDRPAFMAHLKERGVMSGVHYLPNHRHTRFREFRAAPMTVTELVAEQIVTLPLFVDQTDAQVDTVIEAVNTFRGAGQPFVDAPRAPATSR